MRLYNNTSFRPYRFCIAGARARSNATQQSKGKYIYIYKYVYNIYIEMQAIDNAHGYYNSSTVLIFFSLSLSLSLPCFYLFSLARTPDPASRLINTTWRLATIRGRMDVHLSCCWLAQLFFSLSSLSISPGAGVSPLFFFFYFTGEMIPTVPSSIFPSGNGLMTWIYFPSSSFFLLFLLFFFLDFLPEYKRDCPLQRVIDFLVVVLDDVRPTVCGNSP